jgi:hypothetical protein
MKFLKISFIKQFCLFLFIFVCFTSCSKDSSEIKYVFVTGTTSYNGNLGGLTGADEKCQAAAVAAGLSGTFKALISTSTISAASRLGIADFYLLNGTKVISSGNLSNLLAKIDVMANGRPLNVSSGHEDDVWTGSTSAGASSGANCSDWTSDSSGISGSRGDSDDDLVNGVSIQKTDEPCNSTFSLYCFSG